MSKKRKSNHGKARLSSDPRLRSLAAQADGMVMARNGIVRDIPILLDATDDEFYAANGLGTTFALGDTESNELWLFDPVWRIKQEIPLPVGFVVSEVRVVDTGDRLLIQQSRAMAVR